MVKQLLPVVQGSALDLRRVAELVAAALDPTPVGAWLVCDRDRRRPVLTAWARIWVEHALLWGDIRVLGDRTAVAVWLPHGCRGLGPVDYPRRLAAACGSHLHRFQLLDALLGDGHPDAPHHRLVFLATDPGHQRTGRAGALLRHHTGLTRGTVSTCAQALTAAGRQVLAGHGFLQRSPIVLSGHAGQVVPMWRPAPAEAADSPLE